MRQARARRALGASNTYCISFAGTAGGGGLESGGAYGTATGSTFRRDRPRRIHRVRPADAGGEGRAGVAGPCCGAATRASRSRRCCTVRITTPARSRRWRSASSGRPAACPNSRRCCKDSDPMVNQMAEHAMWSIWFRSGARPRRTRSCAAGREALNGRDFAGALEHVDRAIRLDPKFAEAYNQRAIIHYLQERYEESIEDCSRAVERMPLHFGAWAGMGHCHAHLGRTRAGGGVLRPRPLDPPLPRRHPPIHPGTEKTAQRAGERARFCGSAEPRSGTIEFVQWSVTSPISNVSCAAVAHAARGHAHGLEWAGLGALVGSALGALLIPLLLWNGQGSMATMLTLLLLALVSVCGLAWGIIHRPSALRAMEADRQLGLSDLLGTAVSIGIARADDPWSRTVVALADQQCGAAHAFGGATQPPRGPAPGAASGWPRTGADAGGAVQHTRRAAGGRRRRK